MGSRQEALAEAPGPHSKLGGKARVCVSYPLGLWPEILSSSLGPSTGTVPGHSAVGDPGAEITGLSGPSWCVCVVGEVTGPTS